MSSIRSLIRSPWYAVLALVTVAPGLGCVLALMAILDGPFLRALPFPAADRLIVIQPVRPDSGVAVGRLPGPFYQAVLQHRGLEIISFADPETLLALHADTADVWEGISVSPQLLELLGVRPSIGRLLVASDYDTAAATPILISTSLWESRFGRDPTTLGKIIRCEDGPVQVVGIYPSSTVVPAYPRPVLPDFVMPSPKTREKTAEMGESGVMAPLARIKPGVSFREVQAEMATQLGAVVGRYPQYARAGVKISFVRDYMYGGQRRLYMYLACAAVMITLIVCLNSANLLFARLRHHQSNVAVRRALGASRWRLVADVFKENLLVAAAAFPIALAGGALISAYIREEAPRAMSAHIAPVVSVRLALFGVIVAVFIAAVVTVVTVPRVLRIAGEEHLLRGVHAHDGGRRAWQTALVGIQVSLVLAVLIGAGLLTNSVVRLMQLPLGADAERVLLFAPRLPHARYTGAQAKEFWERLVAAVREHPDVMSAAAALRLPMTESTPWASMLARSEDWDTAGGMLPVSRHYFETMSIPLKQGRTFSAEEDRANAPVGVVNEAAVRLIWPDGKALGRTVRSPWFPQPFTVVGVVADTRVTPDRAVMPTMYVPVWTYRALPLRLIVRTRHDAPSIRGWIEAVARRLEKDIVVPPAKTYDSLIAQWWQRPRFLATFLWLFGIVSLAVVAAGTAAVVGYSVHLRSRELALRAALGATRHGLCRLVLRETLVATALGVAAGTFAGASVGRLLRSELYGLTPLDPLTYTAVASVLAFVVIGAAYVPAWIASHRDPAATLRYE
jgi:putative ABC transport system permease protein